MHQQLLNWAKSEIRCIKRFLIHLELCEDFSTSMLKIMHWINYGKLNTISKQHKVTYTILSLGHSSLWQSLRVYAACQF